MKGRSVLGVLLATVVAFAAVIVVVAANASSSGGPRWVWSETSPRVLVETAGSSQRLSLVVSHESSEPELRVLVDGIAVQTIRVDEAGASPLRAFLVMLPRSDAAVVGVARSDVARVILSSALQTHELPLNDANAFALKGWPVGVRTELRAFAPDGSPLGALRLPLTGANCCATNASQLRSKEVKRPTQRSAVGRYTVANRGTRVRARDNAAIFGGHPYQLFLLGKLKGRALYRISVTPHFSCWGAGPASAIGKIGVSSCSMLVGAYPLQLDDNLAVIRRGSSRRQAPQLNRVVGIVADQAKSLALERSDGSIVAKVTPTKNLYAFDPPFPRVFLRIVALDASGKPLPSRPQLAEHQTPPLNLYGPRATKVEPSRIGRVIQRGEGQGVTVLVDDKGTVLFDASSAHRLARKGLQGKRAWFACFRVSGQNARHNRSGGITTTLQPTIAFRVIGIKPPFDGCEGGGTYGHKWHDQHGPHSALEIPLTKVGGVFFEDRAAARDLSAFVRSAKTQSLRRKTGRALVTAIRAAYGSEVMQLSSSTASGGPGTVGFWTSGARTIFSERSRFGDRFYVEFRDGKLVDENVRGLAFVF